MKRLEYLKARLASGAIDRRGFLQSAAALGLSTSAITALGAVSAAEAPRRGGRLAMGLASGSTTDTLDPATISNTFTQVWCAGSLRNGLTVVERDGSLGPELAESWESSSDARTWRFKLREGVEFHNGKTMTPADVVASLNHHRGEASKSAAKTLVDPIEDIRAEDGAVVVTLEKANADFPYLLSDVHLMVMPSDRGGNVDWQSGIGTGPYRMREYEPGISARADRNSNYLRSGQGRVLPEASRAFFRTGGPVGRRGSLRRGCGCGRAL